MKTDLMKARKFSNLFRFIDDLNAINDGGLFENNFKNIYPEELELGKENSDNLEASFLDLHICIKDDKFQVGLFDKRDNFPFSIVRMPDKASNMPSKIFYSSIDAEILRIARASNNSNSFFSSVKPLITRMCKQGACKQRTSNILKNFFNQHSLDFQYVVKNVHELLTILS